MLKRQEGDLGRDINTYREVPETVRAHEGWRKGLCRRDSCRALVLLRVHAPGGPMAAVAGPDQSPPEMPWSRPLNAAVRTCRYAENARAHARRVAERHRAVIRSLAGTADDLAATYDGTAALLEETARRDAGESRRELLNRAQQARRRAAHERREAARLREWGHHRRDTPAR